MVRFEQQQRINARNSAAAPIPVLFQKTKLCKFFRIGMCTRGENCTFAHTSEELQPLPNLYKTKMCFELTKNKRCRNPSCPYAHNKSELRPVAYESQKEDDDEEFGSTGFYTNMQGIFYPAICTDSPWTAGAGPQLGFGENSLTDSSLLCSEEPSKEDSCKDSRERGWSRQTTDTSGGENSLCSSSHRSSITSRSSDGSECEELDETVGPPGTPIKWTVKNTFLELSPEDDFEDLGPGRMFRCSSSPVFI